MEDGRVIHALTSRAVKGGLMRLLIFACLCSLAAAAPGQSGSIETSAKQLLELDLSTSSSKVCQGSSSLPLELKITNRDDQEIKIFKFDLWNHFSYSRYQEPGGYGSWGFTISCEALPEDVAENPRYWPVLKPNGTLTSSLNFGLGGGEFQSPGRYKVGTSYRHIRSNFVEFEIVDCKQK